jgi:hypothetical protein
VLLAFELSDHAQVHTAGLPGFFTRFREAAADAHVQKLICAKVYKPARQSVNVSRLHRRRLHQWGERIMRPFVRISPLLTE